MDKALKDMEKSPNDSNRTKGQPSKGGGNKKDDDRNFYK